MAELIQYPYINKYNNSRHDHAYTLDDVADDVEDSRPDVEILIVRFRRWLRSVPAAQASAYIRGPADLMGVSPHPVSVGVASVEDKTETVLKWDNKWLWLN